MYGALKGGQMLKYREWSIHSMLCARYKLPYDSDLLAHYNHITTNKICYFSCSHFAPLHIPYEFNIHVYSRDRITNAMHTFGRELWSIFVWLCEWKITTIILLLHIRLTAEFFFVYSILSYGLPTGLIHIITIWYDMIWYEFVWITMWHIHIMLICTFYTRMCVKIVYSQHKHNIFTLTQHIRVYKLYYMCRYVMHKIFWYDLRICFHNFNYSRTF